jgi:Ni/Fe-hydrogenase 1 B-type cytochrome subunit
MSAADSTRQVPASTRHIPEWQEPHHNQVRVYMWEFPVRLSHWLMVVSITSLSITGYYMHSPYVSAHQYGDWAMGDMRFWHILSAYVFTIAIALRIVWFFLGNKYVRIDQYLPIAKERFLGIFRVAKYYSFRRWRPVSYIGHNPLAGLSYAGIYALALIEIFTGFTLYSQTLDTPWIRGAFGWVQLVISIQYIREIHFCIMFIFWMFFMQHLYTAVLVSIEEETGLMDSIFSGYKFVSEEELNEENQSSH